MARLVSILSILFFGLTAQAAPRVVTALVHSDQTYILDKSGNSLQEYGIGDTIYLIVDGDKERKGYHRVTFDPTNLQGDGWVPQTKVRVLSNYKSSDGKNPSKYQKKYVEREPKVAQESEEDLLSGELTFIEELVSQEQDNLESEILSEAESTSTIVQSEDGENPFEEDLEFLFTEDSEFKETFQSAKNEHFTKGVSKIGISSFSLRGDQFAKSVQGKFKNNLNSEMKFSKVITVEHVNNIETVNDVARVSIPSDISGVFFGVLSSKVGKNRLFKLKYYDRKLKQFMFEKVVSLPLDQSVDPSINKLVTEAATFLRSQK